MLSLSKLVMKILQQNEMTCTWSYLDAKMNNYDRIFDIEK